MPTTDRRCWRQARAFAAPVRRVTPFNAHAARDDEHTRTYGPPTRGFIEQVDNPDPHADAAGRSLAMLRNAAADRAVSMGFQAAQLP